MRARPEPTQLEDLSGASFMGKLLVLPANVRLDWKVIARNKHFGLFGLVKSFITLTPGGKIFFLPNWTDKLAHFSVFLTLRLGFIDGKTFNICH